MNDGHLNRIEEIGDGSVRAATRFWAASIAMLKRVSLEELAMWERGGHFLIREAG